MRDENYDIFYINMNDDRFKMLQESIGFSGETWSYGFGQAGKFAENRALPSVTRCFNAGEKLFGSVEHL